MNGQGLREARLHKGWTQQETAEKLGVTQAYLSMLERGRRALPYSLVRKAVGALHAPATALPLREETFTASLGDDRLRSELAGLGYPGFAHLQRRARNNPAQVLLKALNEADLDSRVVGGLPWLALEYADLDWDWAVQKAKLLDRQNRLGFVATLALQLASKAGDQKRARKLREYGAVLERSRLVKEDTLCHDSLTEAERSWLRVIRSETAKHWNLLTDMKAEDLPHGRP